MPDVYLTRRRGRLFALRGVCPVCVKPSRRPRYWYRIAYAFHHPNPLRSNVIVWRCRKHARLRFVPLDDKQGLGGGVYR